jgi:copper homeostasis protein
MILEICAQTIQSCLNAQKGGAFRVELCSALELGGLTPSSGLIQLSQQYITVPVYPLIRPRPGNFVFSRVEIESMKRDIENCKAMGAPGVVIGALDDQSDVDFRLIRDLVNTAKPMDVTFHRAFDLCADPLAAMETIIETGCSRILTSGQQHRAIDGIDLLKTLCEKAGDRIIIMAGGGVKPEMIQELHNAGIREYHMSASSVVVESGQEIIDQGYSETEVSKVKAAKQIVKAIRSNSRS